MNTQAQQIDTKTTINVETLESDQKPISQQIAGFFVPLFCAFN
jgi:hypothetical protein